MSLIWAGLRGFDLGYVTPMHIAVPSTVAAIVLIIVLTPWIRLYYKSWKANCSMPTWFFPYDVFGYYYAKATNEAQAAGTLKKFTMSNFEKMGMNSFVAVRAGRRTLYTRDPRIAQFVFSTAFDSFGVSPFRGDTRDAFVGPGIYTVDGAHWEFCHNTLRPFWHVAQAGDLTIMAPHVDNLLRHIRKANGRQLDLAPLLTKLWLDVSTELLLGESIASLGEGKIERAELNNASKPVKFIKDFNQAMAGVGKRLARGYWNHFFEPFGYSAQWLQHCDSSRAYVDEYISRALAAKKNGGSNSLTSSHRARLCLIDELVKVTDDREFIRGQVVNVFLPARANAMRGSLIVLFLLARHPQCWAKIRQEALRFQNVEEINADSMKACSYTEYCIYEALRHFTPNTRTHRVALKDIVLPFGGGPGANSPTFLQQGDSVFFETAAQHGDEKLWGEDANEFKPERWTKGCPAWSYLAFSGGPRVCPAERLIVTQYSYLLLRLAWSFEVLENADEEHEFVEDWRFLGLDSRNGLKVAFHN